MVEYRMGIGLNWLISFFIVYSFCLLLIILVKLVNLGYLWKIVYSDLIDNIESFISVRQCSEVLRRS